MLFLALCAVCVSACGAGNEPKTYTVSFIVDGQEYFSGEEQWDKSFGEDRITEIKQGYKDKIILTAKWEIVNYTITYELDGGENNSSNVSSYNIETPTITFAEPENTDINFQVGIKGIIK